jgi:LmbE family N-acetylglucosaminyl deacetylase
VINVINAQRVLAVSPHLDDAALSAGGLLGELATGGAEVHVLTLFSGTPAEPLSLVAKGFHDNCGLPHDLTAFTLRRQEDEAALAVLGARAHRADLLDAVYRRRSDGRWLCDHNRAMFDTAEDAEELMPTVVATVEQHCQLVQPDLVLTCAGTGHHADHLLTNAAVTAVTGGRKTRMLLWEDLPYAVGSPGRTDLGKPCLLPITSDAWIRKREAIALYASQTRMLWTGEEDWAATLLNHASSRGAGKPVEVFWNTHKAVPEP